LKQSERNILFKSWIENSIDAMITRIEPASSDASFRSYYRIILNNEDTFIAVDSPPEHENNRQFLRIAQILNDMGIEYTKGNPRGAKYSRYKVPVAATAAGVAAIDGIWQDLKDNSGFTKDCEVGRSLGYAGKSVIHPDQIKTVHKIFHPSKPEIAWAKKVCSVYKKSTKKGKGATVVDGKMIDEVHYKRAKALLEI